MSFIAPPMLLSLLLIPPLVYYYLRIQQRRQRLAARYGTLGIVHHAGGFGLRRHIPFIFFLLSLIFLAVGLARPEMMLSLPRVQGTVMLAFDVSGSMAAEDFEPTRIDVAKTAARDFVEQQPSSVQIGVLAFSDNGLIVQAPTYDREAVLKAISRMTPERGTSLGNGIYASLNKLLQGEPTPSYYTNLTPEPTIEPTPMPQGVYTNSVIVLLTDGENNEPPEPLEAAQAAIDRGVRIYTVGIGSQAGTDLNVDGFTYHTQLDETTLRQIAQLTDGVYYNADNTQALLDVYKNLDPQLVFKAEKIEATGIFAGLGIFLLLTGGILTLLWFGRVP